MKTCVIVPVYNHEGAVTKVVQQLKRQGLPCFLVNDGSSPECTRILENCAIQEAGWLSLINREANGGKGAAVIDGFRSALAMGYSHAIQIDADDQHDVADIPKFLVLSKQHPDALILGQPIFDASIPKSRLYGRQVTNAWIAINTISLAIADGMCGFRLYPLAAVRQLIDTKAISQGMDFDIDITVRLYWQGLQIINLPTVVKYPYDGVSHFRLWQDNLAISKNHARLFFGMLIRFPQLIRRHWQ